MTHLVALAALEIGCAPRLRALLGIVTFLVA